MAEIQKDTMIGDLLKMGDQRKISAVLMKAGMHCLGCAIANHETVEEAAGVHGMDPDQLIKELNEVIKKG